METRSQRASIDDARPRPDSTALAAPARPPWIAPELFPFESRLVDADGHRIHYVDEGRGPLVLLMHPAPGWCGYFAPLIRELRRDCRCVAPDLPGFGLSVARQSFAGSLRAYSAASTPSTSAM